MKFIFPWRSYQKRILYELDQHLKDDKLHVIAAPGSGKTVVGLEVIHRINKPTLVLAPTIAIRDQWVDRLLQMFLPELDGVMPQWISLDAKKPEFLTVSTYQGLYHAFSDHKSRIIDENNENEGNFGDDDISILDVAPSNSLVKKFKDLNIELLVLDEAHHLRSNWWRALTKIIKSLENVKTLSLTATPPYDVNPGEWSKYSELCGPVDSEVHVPELVMNDNLCPHQDYVYLSVPTGEENIRLRRFQSDVEDFIAKLKKNQHFIRALKQHPWIQKANDNVESIFDNTEFFSSILVFLNDIKENIPRKTYELMTASRKNIPPFTNDWLEILLKNVLYGDNESEYFNQKLIVGLIGDLKKIGAIERKQIELDFTDAIQKMLSNSTSKLDSILKIVKLEAENLQDNLRMVILTDYIRKDYLPANNSDEKPINKIGVVPIFEILRRKAPNNLKLGILCGSLVLVPKSSISNVIEIAEKYDIAQEKLNFKELAFDEDYAEMKISGEDKRKIVKIITELFTTGGITVLTGTKSLLGEGWDAPCINTLILASFVGSFMLSNQMRGRAIIVEPGNPNKTANIWHLVCIHPGKKDPGDDFAMLERRCKSFVGVAYNEPIIETGIQRFNLPRPPFNKELLRKINEHTAKKALDRPAMIERWNEALINPAKMEKRMVEEFVTNREILPKKYMIQEIISSVFPLDIRVIFLVISLLLVVLIPIAIFNFLIFEIIIVIGLIVLLVLFLPVAGKLIRFLIKHGSLKASIGRMASVVLTSLCETTAINTSPREITLNLDHDNNGHVHCYITGCTRREQSIFINALQEVFEPIENPRYMILREFRVLNRIIKEDFHAVPSLLAENKDNAEKFAKLWQKQVSSCKLVYTRRKEGRLILLRARTESHACMKDQFAEALSRWK